MAAAAPSMYRRALPSPPAVDFTSPDGKRLFSEALEGGTMEGFFGLASCFQTQSEPAFCGLASLAVVLNALAIDPGRRWKGPWRWFDESMLDCCEPLDKVKAKGITFGKVACLAHCAGAKVQPFRAHQVTVDDLRRHLVRCASSTDCHLIASYNRRHFKQVRLFIPMILWIQIGLFMHKMLDSCLSFSSRIYHLSICVPCPLLQTGTGHFSPIGGYHAGQDMVLILDVARFKYPPHWVPLPLLWEAMNTTDESTGLLRGYLLFSVFHSPAMLLIIYISLTDLYSKKNP
jgi:glutathione gamma-glutamylcysteinyltransferase